MKLKEKLLQLSEESRADLHHIVESRLIELGAIVDPYGLTTEQVEKIDSQLMEEDAKETAPAKNELVDEPQEEYASDGYQQSLELIESEIASSEDKDELLALMELTAEAVKTEANKYPASVAMSNEEWQKIIKGL